jgi:hypothetical protein
MYTLIRVRNDLANMRRRSTAALAEGSEEAITAAQKEEKAKEEQFWLYIRLSLQFFVLFIVYVPDSIGTHLVFGAPRAVSQLVRRDSCLSLYSILCDI